jgi:hypothetical protein
LVYDDYDYDNANACVDLMKKAGKTFGINIDAPGDKDYYEVPSEQSKKKDGSGFVERLREKDVLPLSEYKIAVVILAKSDNKKLIKAFLDN